MSLNMQTRQKFMIYSLWLTLGTFGAHRFYLGRIGTGTILLLIAALQLVIFAVTFAEPLRLPSAYYLWPPVSAFMNVKSLIELLLPPAIISSFDAEGQTVRPLLWIVTLPSLVVTMWTIRDGFYLDRWIASSNSPGATR